MKTLILIVVIFLSQLLKMKSEEYENINFEWQKIDLPEFEIFNSKPVITYKNELFITSPFMYSNDKGVTFKKYLIDEYGIGNPKSISIDIMGYTYDEQNGIYLIGDNWLNSILYYIPPSRDTVILLKDDFFVTLRPKTNEYFAPVIDFFNLINDDYILTCTNYNAWIYDIKKNHTKSVLFVDSLIKCNLDSTVKYFKILHSDFDNELQQIKIYYRLDNDYFMKYSDDYGINWANSDFDNNCIPIFPLGLGSNDPFESNSSLYYWNQNGYRFNKQSFQPLYRFDKNCNKKAIFEENNLVFYYWRHDLSRFYSNDSILSFYYGKENFYYSQNNGDKIFRIINAPLEWKYVPYLYPTVFTDGSILITLLNSENKEKGWLYYGTPKPVSVNNQAVAGNMIIYPNPAGNYITLSESDTKLYTDYEIFDISGRLLQKSELSSFRIDISLLERGSYYLRLLSPSGIATAGFLKME